MSDRKRTSYKRSKILLIFGIILTVAGILLSYYAMYYSSPRFRANGVLNLPKPLKIDIQEGASEKIYYLVNCTEKPSKPVDLKLEFYTQEGKYIGGRFINGLRTVDKGSVVLEDKPSYVLVEPDCMSCNGKVSVTIYYSIIDWGNLAIYSLTGTLFSIAGLISLFIGLNIFLLHRREQEIDSRKKSGKS